MVTDTSPATYQLQLDSDLNELANVRAFCKQVIEAHWTSGNSEDAMIRLQLAVVEAVTNVIEHGYQYRTGEEVTCVAYVDANHLHIEIRHNAASFDYNPDKVPTIDHPREGGMGLYLIQQCMDSVSYEKTDTGQECMHLTMQLPQT